MPKSKRRRNALHKVRSKESSSPKLVGFLHAIDCLADAANPCPVISVISDFILAGFPIIILHKVQIQIWRKILLCALMGLGLLYDFQFILLCHLSRLWLSFFAGLRHVVWSALLWIGRMTMRIKRVLHFLGDDCCYDRSDILQGLRLIITCGGREYFTPGPSLISLASQSTFGSNISQRWSQHRHYRSLHTNLTASLPSCPWQIYPRAPELHFDNALSHRLEL